MEKIKLIYVMDPLCGWCYGNSTNTQKLYDKYKDVLDFEILPAGMWAGTNTRKQSKQMAGYIKKHDLQVQQVTGTSFGENYFSLIEDENIILDSEVPSRAIVTVKKQWAPRAVPFAVEVQKARYWHGKDLNKVETYLDICEFMKLDQAQFLEAFHSGSLKKATQETFLQAQNYASSYPSLLVQKSNKTFVVEQGYASFETIVNEINTLIY